MKRFLLILFSLFFIALIAFGVYAYTVRMGASAVSSVSEVVRNESGVSSTNLSDPRNATYKVEEKYVVLKDGVSETDEATTRLVGDSVQGDIDDDGEEDVVSLLTQDGGGSGTFYYVVGVLKKKGNYLGTNAVLLGDRIVPETLKVEQGMVVVTYRVHGETQAFAEDPVVQKTMYLSVRGTTLSEVAVPEGTEVVGGRMEKKQNTFSFILCGEERAHFIASSSRAYAILQTAYTIRSQESDAPVFMLLAVEKSTLMTSSKEKTPDVSVVSVLSAPKKGACSKSSL